MQQIAVPNALLEPELFLFWSYESTKNNASLTRNQGTVYSLQLWVAMESKDSLNEMLQIRGYSFVRLSMFLLISADHPDGETRFK